LGDLLLANEEDRLNGRDKSRNYVTGNGTRYLEWLALMQHHGCPTRLLDFTRSYFIGLFFAVDDASSNSALWAVNRGFFEYRPGIPASEDYLHSTYNEDAERVVDTVVSPQNKEAPETGVLLVEPYRMNERLSIQQGLFLFPKNLEISFEENLCIGFGARSLGELVQKDSSPAVVKIIIPSELNLRIALILGEMNISAATLFPGLDGYARSQKLHIASATSSEQEKWAHFGRLWKDIGNP